MKRLKNIEGKNEEQLQAIEDQGRKQLIAIKNTKTGSKSLKVISFFSGLSLVTRQLMNEIKMKRKILIPKKLFV